MHRHQKGLDPTRPSMSHLSIDRLAALGDEQPTPAETAHLATCGECARERDAYRTLVAMAQAERAPPGLPLTRWNAISAALPADTPADAAPRTARAASRWPLRAAASVLLLACGAMGGRVSAGPAPRPRA